MYTTDQCKWGLTHLIVPASFLNADQTDDRFAVLHGLVEDGVRITLHRLLLSRRSAVELLHLPPLDRLQSLRRKDALKRATCTEEPSPGVLHDCIPVSWFLVPGPCSHPASSCSQTCCWAKKKKNPHKYQNLNQNLKQFMETEWSDTQVTWSLGHGTVSWCHWTWLL